ncbi:hypothetical protein FRC12_001447 [Ceratobasidium sp. 428]|nr:hypothetical protein FRC12_001447 [Ceratobasidium sp. 428]
MCRMRQTILWNWLFHGIPYTIDDIPCVQFFREHPELSVAINITSDTPLLTVVQWLASRSSITDLTDELSRSLTVTPFAVARGGLSDVYRATRSNGAQLAIKCLRQHDPKHVKVCIVLRSRFWGINLT